MSKKFIKKYIIASILSFVLLFNNTASALDTQFYSGNNILFYDPTVICGEGSSSASLVGGDNAEKAFNFFVSKGYSPQQSAGIVGNMVEESGVLPMRKQSTPPTESTSSSQVLTSGSGWGIVQWTPPSKMINPSLAAGKTHAEIDSLEYQLQFLLEQLDGTGIGAKISEKGAGDHLRQQTTIDGAARSFMTKYERPQNQSEEKQKHRSNLANDVFGKYSGGAASSNTASSTTSTCGSSGGGDIVSIAQAELAKGVKEQPIGCDEGNPSRKGDCGPEVNKYTDNTLEYWCADFVSWVYNEAGTPFTGGQSGGWRIAGVKSVRAWFEKNGTYTKNGPGVTPKPGDAYMTAGESHIGIVEKVENGKIHTISGNTSVDNYRNGVGVGQSTYAIGSSSISGFGSLSK